MLKISEKTPKSLCFGDFSYDLVSGELRKGRDLIPLRPQAVRVLKVFVSRPGDLISHNDLGAEIWGDAPVMWQDGMHQIIRDLRKALGDDPKNPVYIETINRRGYRFHLKAKTPPHRLAAIKAAFSIKSRDALLFGGGVLTIPMMIVTACLMLGITG